ncbi:MAG: ribosome maturation factor RimM [Candidatus Mesenet longicola]|uniref:Ribosome maturation factor RimM n=1 Tax=Candidatus Mesenet longicola TaxID=1892558 RepID=A0A8J3MMA1_9RICK|nr:MAG: ribosome maturation factor RimM [Candidatus Mesenet longicola]
MVCLGVVLSPHGIKGAVKIKTFTEKPENIAIYGELTDGNKSYTIKSVSIINDNIVIAYIKGIDSRCDADLLRNKKLYISRESLPLLANENESYVEDLIDSKVKLIDDTDYGYVKAVYNFGAGDIIEILIKECNKAIMLPFSKEIFIHIDSKQKIITLDLPEFIDENDHI